jgi:hypothetical protein
VLQSRGGRDGRDGTGRDGTGRDGTQRKANPHTPRIARAFARYVLTVASRTALFLKLLSHRTLRNPIVAQKDRAQFASLLSRINCSTITLTRLVK